MKIEEIIKAYAEQVRQGNVTKKTFSQYALEKHKLNIIGCENLDLNRYKLGGHYYPTTKKFCETDYSKVKFTNAKLNYTDCFLATFADCNVKDVEIKGVEKLNPARVYSAEDIDDLLPCGDEAALLIKLKASSLADIHRDVKVDQAEFNKLIEKYKREFDELYIDNTELAEIVKLSEELDQAISILQQPDSNINDNNALNDSKRDVKISNPRSDFYKLLSKAHEITLQKVNPRLVIEIFIAALIQARQLNDKNLIKIVISDVADFFIHYYVSKQSSRVPNDIIKEKIEKLLNENFNLDTIRYPFFANDKTFNLAEFLKKNTELLKKNIEEYFKLAALILDKDPNCTYSVLYTGSLATLMATPYSNVNFFILSSKFNPRIEAYFAKYVELINLLIICNGESRMLEADFLCAYYSSNKLGIRVSHDIAISAKNDFFGVVNTPEMILEKLSNFSDVNLEIKQRLNALLLVEELYTNNKDDKLCEQYKEQLSNFIFTKNGGLAFICNLRTYINNQYMKLQEKLESFEINETSAQLNVKELLTYLFETVKITALFLNLNCNHEIIVPNSFWTYMDILQHSLNDKELHAACLDLFNKFLKRRLIYQQQNQTDSNEIMLDTSEIHFNGMTVDDILRLINKKSNLIIETEINLQKNKQEISVVQSLQDQSEFQINEKEPKTMSTTAEALKKLSQKEEVQSTSTNQLATQLIDFHMQAASLMVTMTDPQRLQLILTNPQEYGLTKTSLSYQLIEAKCNKLSEQAIHEKLTRFKTADFKNFAKEKDKFGNTPSHWGTVLDYPKIGNFLITKFGNKKNKLGLTATIQAAAIKSNAFLLERFKTRPEFTEVTFPIKNEKGEVVTVTLNELHAAMMFDNADIISDIFEKFADKHTNINTEIKGIGNLLHLIVYIANNEINQDRPAVNALNMLHFLLQQPLKGKNIIGLLTEKANNQEECTPLMLAAKHGHVSLVKTLITYLMSNVDEAKGLQEVEHAFYKAAQAGQDEVMELLIYYFGFKPAAEHDAYDDTCELLNEKIKTDAGFETTRNLLRETVRANYFTLFEAPDPKEQPYRGLVLKGGGGKGLLEVHTLLALKAYCDQRSQLEINEHKKQSLGFDSIQDFVGTSVGSIFALGLAVNYPLGKMLQMLDYDFATFLENDNLDNIAQQLESKDPSLKDILDKLLNEFELEVEQLSSSFQKVSNSNHPKLRATWEAVRHGKSLSKEATKLFSVIKEVDQNFRGFSKGSVAYRFLEDILRTVKLPLDITFGELAKKIKEQPGVYKHLHVVVTNLTQETFEVLSTRNDKYKHYVILDAVRCSMSYPVVFEPHYLTLKENNNIIKLPDEYIDGGALRNYAIDELDFKKYVENDWVGDPNFPILNKSTIGISFKVEEKKVRATPFGKTEGPLGGHPILDRIRAFISLFMEAEALISHHMDREYHRSIIVDTGPITTFTFKKLSADEKRMLKEKAVEAVEAFTNTKLENDIEAEFIQSDNANTNTNVNSNANPQAPTHFAFFKPSGSSTATQDPNINVNPNPASRPDLKAEEDSTEKKSL